MSRKERRAAASKVSKQQVPEPPVAITFAALKDAAKKANGEPARALIGGWFFVYTEHPKLGHHLSISQQEKDAGKETWDQAAKELAIPEDCQFYDQGTGVLHLDWGRSIEDERIPDGWYIELESADDVSIVWSAMAIRVACEAARLAEELGVSTAGAHFQVIAPSGVGTCCHVFRRDEQQAPVRPHKVTPKATLH